MPTRSNPRIRRPRPRGTRFEDLRLVASLLPADEAGLLGYARAMVTWRRRHRYCGTCGAKTVPAKGGHVLVCTNPACRHEQFPRIDPAIIVLVSDAERALLGRQAAWPAGRYSTIAGFVEPGESLEDAVAREVLEETGVTVDRIEYHSSQPWPFPSSLMLGFTARALTREIRLEDKELEDARWFTRADLDRRRPAAAPAPIDIVSPDRALVRCRSRPPVCASCASRHRGRPRASEGIARRLSAGPAFDLCFGCAAAWVNRKAAPPLALGMLNTEIAVLRFGLGARPGELKRAAGDPRAWLLAQTRGSRGARRHDAAGALG